MIVDEEIAGAECVQMLERYHHLRQWSEIRERLARRCIRLSDGSGSALCNVHLLAAPTGPIGLHLQNWKLRL